MLESQLIALMGSWHITVSRLGYAMYTLNWMMTLTTLTSKLASCCLFQTRQKQKVPDFGGGTGKTKQINNWQEDLALYYQNIGVHELEKTKASSLQTYYD